MELLTNKSLVEFVGTYLFLLVIIVTGNPWAIGATLAIIIYLWGHISGGNFNPAVTIMMTLAMAWAETIESQDIFIGVNAVDYSGYPDCRPEYIASFQKMANLATKTAVEGMKIKIHTPLINLSKSEIICLGKNSNIDYSATVSCYQADKDGRACGKCDSCRLRKEGFKQANIKDPTQYVISA